MGKASRWTNKKRDAFLAALSRCGNVSRAVKESGIGSKDTVYDHRRADPEFAAMWDSALDEAVDKLEAEAWRRAHDGIEEPVYQGGQLVGTMQKYSDTLLIFLLKGNRPRKYRERFDIGSEPGRPLQVLNQKVEDLSTEQLMAIAAEGIEGSK